jgi:hypothetical protein
VKKGCCSKKGFHPAWLGVELGLLALQEAFARGNWFCLSLASTVLARNMNVNARRH